MPHDVFISYSTKDKTVADAVTAYLESAGIRCWIAPRDILPGKDWGEAIITAIEGSKAMVLLFSNNANESPQIKREVERAVNKGLALIPFRIENVPPSKSLEYFISTPHWLDAMSPPLESHLHQLQQTVSALVGVGSPAPALGSGAYELPQRSIPYATPTKGPRPHWSMLAAVGAAAGILTVILVLFALRGVRRGGPPAAIVVPRPAPAATLPANAPARRQVDEAGNTIDDLEKLDGRIKTSRALLADNDPRALTDDLGFRVQSELDFSDTGANRLSILWNDWERIRGLTTLGAREADVQAFIDAVRTAQESHQVLVARVNAVALSNRLQAAADKLSLPRDPASAEPKLLAAALSAAQTAFEVCTKLAYVAGLRVAASIPNSIPNDAQFRLLKLSAAGPASLKDAAAIESAQTSLQAALAKSTGDSAAAQNALNSFRDAAVARLLSPTGQKLASADPDGKFIDASRTLRAASDVKGAQAVLAAFAEIRCGTDANAEAFYTTALKYAEFAKGQQPPTGLYIYELAGRQQVSMDSIAVGDILLTYNDQPLAKPTDLTEAIKANNGTPARIDLLRLDKEGNLIRLTRTVTNGDPTAATRPI